MTYEQSIDSRMRYLQQAHDQVALRGWMLLVLLLVGFGLSAAGQVSDEALAISASDDFAVENWQTENGMPQNSVNAIFQGTEGYIWFGTFSGLVHFDGARFVTFDSGSSTNLINSRVTSLYQDSTKRIWIGHETGDLTCMVNGIFSRVNLGSAWHEHGIIGINSDKQGDVWVLSDSGALLRIRDQLVIRPLPGLSDAPTGAPSICRDIDGRLWWVYRGVAATVESDRLVPFRFDDKTGEAYFEKIAPSRDGGLWVVGQRQLRRWREGKWSANLGACPWGEAFVTMMAESREGKLFVGTLAKGLFIIQTNGDVVNLTQNNILPDNWVRCVTEDLEGNIWVGTSGRGLCVLRNRKVIMRSAPDKFEGRTLLSVAAGHDDDIWVGTEGAGLYHFMNGEWKHYGPTNGLSNPFVWTVLVDRKGTVWVGTWSEGLFQWDGEKFFNPPGLENLRAPVTSLLEGSGGEMWIGTGAGLLRYESGRVQSYSSEQGLVLPDIRCIVQDNKGTIWFGMLGGGLGRLKDHKLKVFKQTDGLSSDSILSMFADTDGAIWIGTLDKGLCRLRDGKFQSITSKQGLPNNVIGHIADDGNGNLWFTSQNGIFLAQKLELNRCADNPSNTVKWLVYGKRHGLDTLACSGGFQPSGARTPDGKFWFPTSKGLAVLNLADVSINQIPPPVLIEEVQAAGKTTETVWPADDHNPAGDTVKSASAELTIPPGRQRLEFHYTALSFRAPEKVRFKYRLVNLESDWVDAGARRSVNYSYVPPGHYEFQVIACNNDGIWNQSGAKLSIDVLPFFWQTLWFKVTAVLVGLAGATSIGLLINRHRTRLKLERIEREHALERERTRIAQDIHDDLGASLTRITMLCENATDEIQSAVQVGSSLQQITGTARELTRRMDEIVWAVNPRHDTFDSLVNYLCRYAQDYLKVAGVRCRLDVPVELPEWSVRSELRHNLFLAVKEALHNVAKHAHAHEVQLGLVVLPDGFEFTVGDQGCGFDLNEVNQESDGRPGSFRNGLANMRRRMEHLGGTLRVESAPSQGTRVTFKMHLKYV